jgi:hypothetical protein
VRLSEQRVVKIPVPNSTGTRNVFKAVADDRARLPPLPSSARTDSRAAAVIVATAIAVRALPVSSWPVTPAQFASTFVLCALACFLIGPSAAARMPLMGGVNAMRRLPGVMPSWCTVLGAAGAVMLGVLGGALGGRSARRSGMT